MGIRGDVYCTPATRDLCALMLTDTAFIQEQDVRTYNKKIDRQNPHKEKGKKYKSFTNCDHCGAHLLKKENTKVIKVATYEHTGLDEVTYGCLFCKEKTVKNVVIPRREHSTSGGGYSSGGSSHSSGGSFGGGRSGGGGYSGRW